jgi:hypothetical protein
VNLFKCFTKYNNLCANAALVSHTSFQGFYNSFFFLPQYFRLNEQIWQEGLLIDFLQKKTIDNWLKKFVIHSANLFNERLAFDQIVKFYLNLFIWPMHKIFIFELNNVSNLLLINLFLFFFLFFFFAYIYILFMF